MGSVNEEDRGVSKPKIDLLLQEINEVRNRENEYLAHLKALYPEKFANGQTETDEESQSSYHDINGSSKTSNDETVDEEVAFDQISTSKSAKNINHTSPEITSPNKIKVVHTIPMPNSYKNRIFQTTNKKGIMHQFYTTRGKISKERSLKNTIENGTSAFSEPLSVSIQTKIERDDSGKPIRKGYIPVEEKIHRELKDIQDREKELKLLRKERSISYDSDESDTEYEIQMNGKIRPSKSIGEIYEALWQSNSISNGNDSYTKNNGIKNSVSLAQLCDLNDDENDVISSHKLIEKWECLIQERKQQNIG